MNIDESFRLHHVGLLVSDVVTASALLSRRFGYLVESELIEDAQQTALVQFLRLPRADHWTELVAPNGPASVLARAVKQRRGGVHHLCYEVADIDAACAHLRASAMTILSNPVGAAAFAGRRIAWLSDANQMLVELVESGDGPLSLPTERDALPGSMRPALP